MDAEVEDERLKLVDAIRAVYEALKSGERYEDEAPLAADARITCHLPELPEFPIAGEWRGREGFAGWLEAQAACMDYQSFDVQAIEAGDDAIIALIDVAFRHRPSGAFYRGSISHVIHHRDGLIEQLHAHINSARLETVVREAQMAGEGVHG